MAITTIETVQTKIDSKLGARVRWNTVALALSVVGAVVFGVLTMVSPFLYEPMNTVKLAATLVCVVAACHFSQK